MKLSNEQKGAAIELIRQALEDVMRRHSMRWHRDNWWIRQLDWCEQRCVLTVQSTGLRQATTLAGGASIFLPQYDRIFRETPVRAGRKISNLGAPVHWIDDRLRSDDGIFDSLEALRRVLPRFVDAFETRVIPELVRFECESALMEALLSPAWVQDVKLATDPDTRAALITLMLQKLDGRTAALAWGRSEIDRIRARHPLRNTDSDCERLRLAVKHVAESG